MVMRQNEEPASLMTHAEQPSTRSIQVQVHLRKSHVDEWKTFLVLPYIEQRQVAYFDSCVA